MNTPNFKKTITNFQGTFSISIYPIRNARDARVICKMFNVPKTGYERPWDERYKYLMVEKGNGEIRSYYKFAVSEFDQQFVVNA